MMCRCHQWFSSGSSSHDESTCSLGGRLFDLAWTPRGPADTYFASFGGGGRPPRRKTKSSMFSSIPGLSLLTRRRSRRNYRKTRQDSHDRTVLSENDQHDLYSFRDDAEYSDYLFACIGDYHAQRDQVVFYQLEVQLSDSRWTTLRRFSEFRALRNQLIRHFAHRTTSCKICANIFQTIQECPFPQRKWWNSMTIDITRTRKRLFQEFVLVLLATVRSLRQHARIMTESSARLCEIQLVLFEIEEFLGLNFFRYVVFLTERGLLRDEQSSEVEMSSSC